MHPVSFINKSLALCGDSVVARSNEGKGNAVGALEADSLEPKGGRHPQQLFALIQVMPPPLGCRLEHLEDAQPFTGMVIGSASLNVSGVSARRRMSLLPVR